MHKCVCCIFFLVATNFLLSQNSIIGTVLSAIDNKPIANANIFVPNTTYGTTSNNEGYFELQYVPYGNNDVIISCVGYSTVSYSYTGTQLPLKLTVVMPQKVNDATTITVMPIEKDGWEKWGKLFMEAYIGTTFNAQNCKLLNKEVLGFRYSKRTGELTVSATDVIKIQNSELGYTINHQLELFSCNIPNKSVVVEGYPYFTPMETTKNRKIKRYSATREVAYNGSMMHLIRSIYSNTITQNGFVIRQYDTLVNYEKLRVKAIVATNKILKINSVTIDSTAYYNRVMQQPKYFIIIGKILEANEICKIDTNSRDRKILHYNKSLYVEYKNEKQDERYYSTQFMLHKTPYQTTKLIWVDPQKTLTITADGNYANALAIYLDGYMGWEKMADLLPLDYEVAVKEK